MRQYMYLGHYTSQVYLGFVFSFLFFVGVGGGGKNQG